MTTVAHMIHRFKVYVTAANLHGCSQKRKMDDKLKRQIIQMVTKEPRGTSKVNCKVKLQLGQTAPSIIV